MELRDKILEGATNLFRKFGTRSVTMDDVAREVSASKKTIYLHFENKKDLVLASVEKQLEDELRGIKEREMEAENSIHELLLTSQCMRQHFKEMNPSLLLDLQKYHRNAWEKYLEFKVILGQEIKKNLITGIEEGNYRAEINPEIISQMRVDQVQSVFDSKIYSDGTYSFSEVQMIIFDHFIYGLLTEKGKKVYQNYLENIS